jgi:biotin operon repressor
MFMSDYVGLYSSKVADSSKEIGGSGNSNRNKPKKTSFRIQQLINEIGKMLSAGKLDREIMDELQIKRSQYYEYKSKLFQQSADLFDRFNDKNRGSLIYQKELLSERLTRLYKQAELDLTQSSPAEGGNTRASIYLAAQNIAINILKLESEGLRILANGQGRQLRGLPTYTERRDRDIVMEKRGEIEDDESKIY